MSGLIWSALGQSVGNISSTIGNYMMRAEQDEERQRERAELQRERLAAAEREKERDRQLRMELAAQRGGGGADGGLGARDIGEGGLDEGMLARRAGMTVPELRAMRRYSETGDAEPFKQDVTRYSRDEGALAGEDGKFSDAVSRKYATLEETVTKELPPGFEREARAKLQTLAKIEESYRLGGKYDDVTKGRRNQQEIDASELAMRQPGAAGVIGQGMAAGEGKGAYKVQGNTKINEFTGESESTEVGESIEARNRKAAQGKPAAPVAIKDVPYERLTAQAETLRKAVNEASGERKKMLETQFDEVMNELRRRRQSSAGSPGAAPAPASAASMPAPQSRAEFDKLPKGTRYKAPDGSIRIK